MKFILILIFNTIGFVIFAQSFNESQKSIANLIQFAYADGLQNEGDTQKIDLGFHPDFQMIYKGKNMNLNTYTIEQWRTKQIERKANGELPRSKNNKVTLSFEFIDITGDVAVAKVNYFEGEKQTYVDYISLYNFNGEWKIISKIFHRL